MTDDKSAKAPKGNRNNNFMVDKCEKVVNCKLGRSATGVIGVKVPGAMSENR